MAASAVLDDRRSKETGDEGSRPADLTKEECRAAVQRLISSQSFSKAARLTQFLLYVAERTLQNRRDELTEQQIGIHVFGRAPDYNPGDDTIVRVTARQLRQKLALYYQGEGKDQPIQISIPTGGYTPTFQVSTSLPHLEPSTLPPPSLDRGDSPIASIRDSRQRRVPYLVIGALLLAVVLIWKIGFATTGSPSTLLWDRLFRTDRPTYIVTGDGGLNIFENLARRQVDVNEYASRSYLSDPMAKTPAGYMWDPLAVREYSPISDIQLTSRLVTLPQARHARTHVIIARDLNTDELQQANLILIGSPMYDPWEQMFDRDENFVMRYNGQENTITVLNRAPLPGEKPTYAWRSDDPERVGYAVISLTDNLAKTGKVLFMEGTTAVGTAAAADFVFSQQFDSVLKSAIDRRGRVGNFDLLLETRFTGGASSHARVLSMRLTP